MNVGLNERGDVVLTVAYNFGINLLGTEVIMDENSLIEMLRFAIGKPFKDETGKVIGHVVDMTHIDKTAQVYLYIKIDDRYRDFFLKKYNMMTAGKHQIVSMGVKTNGKKETQGQNES